MRRFVSRVGAFWLAWLCLGHAYCVDRHYPERLERIAFGSCNHVLLPQPLWPTIAAWAPDIWIGTGDIIYADTTNEVRLRQMYRDQKAKAGYVRLREQCPVLGVWDDHDYGRDGAGKEFVARDISQRALLDFLDEPEE